MQFSNSLFPAVSAVSDEQKEREERAEKEFASLLSAARSAYDIPRSAFNSYRVKRGLREVDGTGVTAGVTRIGNAHGYVVNEGEKCPVEGVLEYRGYDIRDLIDHFTAEGRFGFEECAYLLFSCNQDLSHHRKDT